MRCELSPPLSSSTPYLDPLALELLDAIGGLPHAYSIEPEDFPWLEPSQVAVGLLRLNHQNYIIGGVLEICPDGIPRYEQIRLTELGRQALAERS